MIGSSQHGRIDAVIALASASAARINTTGSIPLGF
jgi:hypothetical protein